MHWILLFQLLQSHRSKNYIYVVMHHDIIRPKIIYKKNSKKPINPEKRFTKSRTHTVCVSDDAIGQNTYNHKYNKFREFGNILIYYWITVGTDFKNEEKNRIKNWVAGLCKAASVLIFRTAILEEKKTITAKWG